MSGGDTCEATQEDVFVMGDPTEDDFVEDGFVETLPWSEGP